MAATSLPNTTRRRRGVVRNVAVAVWYWNSLVMTRMPSNITRTSPKNWPDVKMDPAALTSWAGRSCACGELLLRGGHVVGRNAPGELSAVRVAGLGDVAGRLGHVPHIDRPVMRSEASRTATTRSW